MTKQKEQDSALNNNIMQENCEFLTLQPEKNLTRLCHTTAHLFFEDLRDIQMTLKNASRSENDIEEEDKQLEDDGSNLPLA